MNPITADAAAASFDPIATAAVGCVASAATPCLAEVARATAARITGIASAFASPIVEASQWVWQQERELALLALAAWAASGLALWLL